MNGNFTLGNNRVVCWGDNSQYQSTVPPAAINPVEIKASGNRTCAVTGGHNNALAAVKCWPIGIDPHLDARAADSDGDGITDYYELHESPYVTNPQSSDTDNDGVTDSVDPAPLDGTQTTTEQAATYRYNHLGQRASKTVGGTTTYFVYSSTDGQMIGEYTSSGAPVREYLYLQGERVATVNHTGGTPQVRYVANDHVGQARYAWNDAGTMMFERTQTPFGESMAEQSYAKVPLRFPGQYYDPESGMNQNWNRDYDPAIGRYLQSDPIGLAGGVNTYGYVGQNPIKYVDSMGLQFGMDMYVNPNPPGQNGTQALCYTINAFMDWSAVMAAGKLAGAIGSGENPDALDALNILMKGTGKILPPGTAHDLNEYGSLFGNKWQTSFGLRGCGGRKPKPEVPPPPPPEPPQSCPVDEPWTPTDFPDWSSPPMPDITDLGHL